MRRKQRPISFMLKNKIQSYTLLTLFIVGSVLFLIYWVAPYTITIPPQDAWNKHYPACEFYDQNHRLIYTLRGYDYEFRFPIKLEEVSPDFLRALLSAEDKRFFNHYGVDYYALLRAMWDTATCGRITSGASTVTMQCFRMIAPERRSFLYKLKQLVYARAIEQHFSKNEILEYYINHLPFGGKIVGVEAAARYYFHKRAKDLSLCEATILAGIPQIPNRWRPDKFPKRIPIRHQRILNMMCENNTLTDTERDLCEKTFPHIIAQIDSASFFKTTQSNYPFSTQHFIQMAAQTTDTTHEKIVTTLSPEIQNALVEFINEKLKQYPNVNDGAGVVIENTTGSVKALVGSIDYFQEDVGMINGATARRSPGSTLKPFIFLAAIDEGILIPETVMNDSPFILPDYRPTNYSSQFHGKVSASFALSHSLNIPAVQLTQHLGVQRFAEILDSLNIIPYSDSEIQRAGLSIILGGSETTLIRLTNAYAGLARNGKFFPAQFVENNCVDTPIYPFSEGSVCMLNAMLSSRPLPEAEHVKAAWKTGTSSGNRDAWAIAYTPQYTVGIWCGNKTGRSSPNLEGSQISLPIAGKMIRFLNKNEEHPFTYHGLEEVEICDVSGLRSNLFCAKKHKGKKVKEIPLKQCKECSEMDRAQLKIIYPSPSTYHTHTQSATLHFLSNRAGVVWYLDGEDLGKAGLKFDKQLPLGAHCVEIYDPESQESYQVKFKISQH